MPQHPRTKGTAASAFSTTLSDAIAARGLTLNRLQARLEQRGVSVSMATLSYWSNGRSVPARASSMSVVEALESILELPPGALLSLLSEPPTPNMTWAADRAEFLREQIKAIGPASADSQEQLMAHLEVSIAEDRHLLSTTTTLVVKSRVPGAQGLSIVINRPQGTSVDAHPLNGVTMGRTVHLDGQSTLFEFLYDHPLERGETRRARCRLNFGPSETEVTTGYSLRSATPLLMLTCTFLGDLPRSIVRCFTPPNSDASPREVQRIPVQTTVECVLTDPPIGLHSLVWEW